MSQPYVRNKNNWASSLADLQLVPWQVAILGNVGWAQFIRHAVWRPITEIA